MKSNKSLIQHISDFFEYCEKEKDFSDKTIENYGRYLDRFIFWLKTSKLTHLTPLELSIKHIDGYQQYLSKQNIKKITQNYYLIALRVLISYFIEKEIPCSVQIERIKLLKAEKKELTETLTSEQLEKLLSAPTTSHNIGLRDRTLLEVISSTSLKVAELTAIDKNDIIMDKFTERAIISIRDKRNGTRSIHLPIKTTEWLTEYLNNRKDNDKALFINYRSKKENDLSPIRLTVRSIERMVQKYGNFVGIAQTITPETLRNSYIKSILGNKIDINKNIYNHQNLLIEKYSPNSLFDIKPNKNTIDWNIIENSIKEEIVWLKDNIDTMPEGYRSKNVSITCEDCVLRKLAILIVSGKIQSRKIKFEKSPWEYNPELYQNHSHGEEWHKKMMNAVANYFKKDNFQIALEPILNLGRADIGIFSGSLKSSTYIEIGTTSLYKLLYNLLTMESSIFLILPTEEYMIEFRT